MSSRLPRSNARSFQLPVGLLRGRLVRVALAMPVVAMVSAVLLLTLYCRSLLLDAATGGPVVIGDLPLLLVAGGFLAASASVVLLQSMRLAARVAGPEVRLVRALQRIRSGDLTFRVHLRRGDLLTGLARECNALLDWLNANPPTGSRTGTDIVQFDEATAAVVEENVPMEVGP